MKPGKVGWNELITSDPAAAIAFYTQLFGWGTEAFEGMQGEYTMFTHEGMAFGGVMKTPMPGVPTHWLNYVVVEDIEASIEKSKSLGGEICMGPMDIPDVGRIAVVKDPQGAVIGLHQGPAK
jgi:hypothetical protein